MRVASSPDSGGGKLYHPWPVIVLIFSLWEVRWMSHLEMYFQVRRACLVEGVSVREASRVFGDSAEPCRGKPAGSGATRACRRVVPKEAR